MCDGGGYRCVFVQDIEPTFSEIFQSLFYVLQHILKKNFPNVCTITKKVLNLPSYSDEHHLGCFENMTFYLLKSPFKLPHENHDKRALTHILGYAHRLRRLYCNVCGLWKTRKAYGESLRFSFALWQSWC